MTTVKYKFILFSNWITRGVGKT